MLEGITSVRKDVKGGILMFREQNARMSCFKAWKSGVKPTHLEISFLHKLYRTWGYGTIFPYGGSIFRQLFIRTF